MRVSQNMIYDSSLSGMQARLAQLVHLNEQNSTQKRINRPSDDAQDYGTALDAHSEITRITQWQENADTATSWLSLGDDVLGKASEQVTRLQELAQQAATGTLTATQRQTIAAEARQLFGELIAVSNTEYNGKSIFAGRATGGNAYVETLGTTIDSATGDTTASVSGTSSSTIEVLFDTAGTVGTDALSYRYSSDGGSTWTTGTLAATDTTLSLDTATLTLTSGLGVSATDDTTTGTIICVRPAAHYVGDGDDGAKVTSLGNTDVTATARGTFANSVAVRVTAGATVPAGPVSYQYSTDGGVNWSTTATSYTGTLKVPGGYLDLAAGTGNTVAAGDTFTITSDSAALNLAVGSGRTVQVNSVGTDIFGGIRQAAGATTATTGKNLFEAIGSFIGYLETNNQQGVVDTLDAIKGGHEQLLAQEAVLGARSMRLEFTASGNTLSKTSANATLANVEDADVSQLLIEISKQQTAYSSVLQTSSTIMNMSLLDYL